MCLRYQLMFEEITRRYAGAEPEAIVNVLTPVLIPLASLDRTVVKLPGQTHWHATFSIPIRDEWSHLMVRGRTGKFVPLCHAEAEGAWREIAKGRIINVDFANRIAEGEVYTGTSKQADVVSALQLLSANDFLEIDQYGASAKILSALVEYSLAKKARDEGFTVVRMPEDMAKHLGEYCHYDFTFMKNGVSKRIEVKSLWGTDTRYARLIHNKGNGYETSSCKFVSQDIYAVSLFLRTGNIHDFAFAKSVSRNESIHGLPPVPAYSEYVTQNPLCTIDNVLWFENINDVWDL